MQSKVSQPTHVEEHSNQPNRQTEEICKNPDNSSPVPQKPHCPLLNIDSEAVLDRSVSQNIVESPRSFKNVSTNPPDRSTYEDLELAALEQQMAQLLSEDISRSSTSSDAPTPKKARKHGKKKMKRHLKKRRAKKAGRHNSHR